SALCQRDDHFHFEMDVGAFRWIGKIGTAEQQVIRVFLEEERRLSIRVPAHFDCVRCIVAPYTVNAVDRKQRARSSNRNGDLHRSGNDVCWIGFLLHVLVLPYLDYCRALAKNSTRRSRYPSPSSIANARAKSTSSKAHMCSMRKLD